MRKQLRLILSLSCLLILIGCGNQGPQRPTRWLGKEPELDSAQMALLELNRQMALAADKELLQLAQSQEEKYALYDGGVWVHQIEAGSDSLVRLGTSCTVHICTYRLDGQMLTDIEQTYSVGKFEMPMAIERNINSWNHGAKMRMYAPWYAAYGMKGTEYVAPYENVIFEIEIR
ncbi:MAG: hypothetical protein K6A36_03570 [Paludibacteraceae bacterium]|nr:hypothetical protein [Paludibacteraceae bacterium]